MSALFKKLNLGDRSSVVVLNAPDGFQAELDLLEGVSIYREQRDVANASFVLAFATKESQVSAAAKSVGSGTTGDVLVWIAYPKGTSKRYECKFNRDTGWSSLGDLGFEPVRQVAIDEDWSALRFRRVQFIKKLTRSSKGALSQEGRARTRGRPGT